MTPALGIALMLCSAFHCADLGKMPSYGRHVGSARFVDAKPPQVGAVWFTVREDSTLVMCQCSKGRP